MPTSAHIPGPGLLTGPAQDGSVSSAPAESSAEPPAKEESRWSGAIKPLPAILKQLEARKLTLTILLFAFLILKVLVPAKGDIPTALAIFQTTSLAVTVIGALLSALPLVAVAVLVLIGYRAARNASLEGYALAAAAALVCFFVTPWPVLAASVLIAPLAGYTVRQRQRLIRARGPYWQRLGTLLVLAPCLIVFAYIAGMATWRVLYDVWLPHEMVTLQSGRVEVGYVLNDNSTWIPILRSGERRVVRYRETQVKERALCQLRPKGLLANLTAWQALGPHTLTAVNQPVCPHGFRGNPGPDAARGPGPAGAGRTALSAAPGAGSPGWRPAPGPAPIR